MSMKTTTKNPQHIIMVNFSNKKEPFHEASEIYENDSISLKCKAESNIFILKGWDNNDFIVRYTFIAL